MKNLLILLFLPLASVSQRAYYVSNSGNNSNNGQTPATAWNTSGKVNGFTFSAGDSILYKRGDTFADSLIIPRNTLFIGSYGTGAKPILSTAQTLSSWTLYGGNIYYATVTTSTDDLRMVTVNSVPVEMGRYPNSDSANGGYLTYESYSGGVSITDAQLTGTPDWTGAWVVIRKNRWTADCGTITSHSGTTITYNVTEQNKNGNYGTTPSSPGNNNYGYFIENDLRTLNKNTEWYFDPATKRLYMYFSASPSLSVVKVATGDVLINCSNKQNITIRDLDLQYCNRSGIYSKLGSAVAVRNCDIKNVGQTGVQIFQVNNATIDSCTALWCLVTGYQIYNGGSNVNMTATNSSATNCGKFIGLGWTSDFAAGVGMAMLGGKNNTIKNNFVLSTGRDSYKVTGTNVLCEKLIGLNADSVLDDQGVFYSFQDGTDDLPGTVDTNLTIRYCYFGNGIGNPYGANSTQYLSQGIYLDGRRQDVHIYGNKIFNTPLRGIHTNNGGDINIHDNIIYNTGYGISMRAWPWGSLRNISAKNNVVYSFLGQYSVRYANDTAKQATVMNILPSTIDVDSNVYNGSTSTSWRIEAGTTVNRTLADWQTFTGQDAHSVAIGDAVPLMYDNTTDSDYTLTLTGAYKVYPSGEIKTGSVVIPAWSFFFALPIPTTTTDLKGPFRIY